MSSDVRSSWVGPSLWDAHVCSSTGDREGPPQAGEPLEEAVLCSGATKAQNLLGPQGGGPEALFGDVKPGEKVNGVRSRSPQNADPGRWCWHWRWWRERPLGPRRDLPVSLALAAGEAPRAAA